MIQERNSLLEHVTPTTLNPFIAIGSTSTGKMACSLCDIIDYNTTIPTYIIYK